MKTSRRNIVRSLNGNRYLLTSRRIVELDSIDAQEGAPWYALNSDIRLAGSALNSLNTYEYFNVKSRTSKTNPVIVTALVRLGISPEQPNTYQLGCALFDLKTFKRILKNAGVKTVAQIAKAFAAKAGA
jgi:hypothetical protein